MFALPTSTAFDERIPKPRFYETLAIPVALKRVFVERISLILWHAKLATATLNLPPGDDVTEIEVLELRLTAPEIDEEVFRLIDKAIPYHLLFVLTCEGQAQVWIGYKESAASGASAFKVGRYYHTPWMPEDALHLRIEGLTLDAVYASLVRQIAGGTLVAAPAEPLRDTVARDERRRKLGRQIALLEGRLRREKQLNRRLELNTELKKLKCVMMRENQS